MAHVDAIFDAFPVLRTKRLILREIRPSDAPAIFAIFSDPDVTRFYGMEPYQKVTEAEDLVTRWHKRFADRQLIRWVITPKNETDKVIGTCGFNEWKRHFHCAGVGYDLAPSYWRQGVMSEALTAVLKFGFAKMGLNRVEAHVLLENVASIKLLEKIGFKHEGILRDYGYWSQSFHDLHLYAVLQREFHASLSQ